MCILYTNDIHFIYQNQIQDVSIMNEDILTLKGKEAEEFLEYDSRPLSEDEKTSLQKAKEYYKDHCK